MAKENLSHHQDIEDNQGAPVAAGSGNGHKKDEKNKSLCVLAAVIGIIVAASIALACFM